ncbi:HAD family hydrolase [Vibrio diazotrophicus]|uniref:HAD family hydrolase n=1 Tax=Vibrio diazotrophicus TaxID=685 RepID=UPI000C9DA9B3|nr:HAD-IA family hydrolase [Vibrio diazotrophicus]PNH80573.1 2-haloalkanoic acid dehalogenase [Vibrio diazotrophicus]
MVINNQAVWVFDLDDTIYPEYTYRDSGYQYISDFLNNTYKVDLSDKIQLAHTSGKDVLAEICDILQMPESFKSSLLWMYRLHIPNIKIDESVKKTIEKVNDNCLGIAVITDGRSISQRNKMAALELDYVDTLVSEEWDEVKPGTKRFLEIQQRYPNAKQFIYVGDNIKKDFITPNNLGWLTIGIRDSGFNIHPQNVPVADDSYFPNLWVNSFSEIQDYIC